MNLDRKAGRIARLTKDYVAGLEPMIGELDAVFAQLAGSKQEWERRKAELMAGGRWVELVY